VRWKLGVDTPITHMGRVLENAGIPIVKTLASTEKVDAFSRRGRTSIVVLNTFKNAPSRWIFDMAHELGHFVCHSKTATGSVETEHEADAFASAFLLPAKAFSREFRAATFSWEHMFELKARWQVSLAAIVYRAYSLSLIDALTYRRAWKYLSARQWRKSEPHEPSVQEPELLRESLTTLHQELGEHPMQLCQKLHFKPSTFQDVTGIELPKSKRTKDILAFQRLQ
jgi:Zn-dependent peptidase ImmA (M78 family)